MDEELMLKQRARTLVIAKTVYKGVVVLWVIGAAAMLAIWQITTPDAYFWPIWPILGMTVAGIIWGLALYGRFPFKVSESRVDEELVRLKQNS